MNLILSCLPRRVSASSAAVLIASLSFFVSAARAQVTSPSPPTNQSVAPKIAPPAAAATVDTVVLSPFVVQEGDDRGYQATTTATTSRLKSAIKDLGMQVQVFTPEFLEDVSAINLEEAYLYSANTETYLELQDPTRFDFGALTLRPNTRVRGLSPMNTLRGQFVTNFESDMYNSERFTLSSGANAVLMGQPGPAGNAGGTTDVSTLRAVFKNRGQVDYRIDSYGSLRFSGKYNRVILKDKLAVVVAGLNDRQKYMRRPTYDNNERLYGAITYRPFKKTEIRFDQEMITRVVSRALSVLPVDNATVWTDSGRVPFNNTPGYTPPAATSNFVNYTTASPVYTYPNSNVAAPLPIMSWANTVQVRKFSALATTIPVDRVDTSLNRPDLYSLFANQFGFGRQGRDRGKIYHAHLEQEITRHLAVELSHGYDMLREKDGGYSSGSTSQQFHVDANAFLPDGVTRNPNVGKLYIMDQGFLNNRLIRDQETRLAVSYDLDLRQKAGAMKWLGRHRFGGLYSYYDHQDRTQTVTTLIGGTPSFILNAARTDPTVLTNLNHPARRFFTRYYFDDPQNPHNPGLWYRTPINGDLHATVQIPDPVTGEPYTVHKHDYLQGSALPDSGTARNVISRIYSVQSLFLKDRLVVTAGTRKDSVRSAGLRPIDTALQANGLFPKRETTHFTTWNRWESDTVLNWGAVAHVLPWMSLSYNYGENYSPGGTNLNPFGRQIQGSNGKSEDYGVRFGLMNDKLTIRLNYYDNQRLRDTAGSQSIKTIPFNIENRVRRDIDPTIAPDGLDAVTRTIGNYQAVRDVRATGFELEATYTPNRNWSFTANGGTQKTVNTGSFEDWIEWATSRVPVWQRAGRGWDVETISPTSAETIHQAYDTWIAGEVNLALNENGRQAANQRPLRINLIGKYQFTEGRLKGLQIGGGGRYRGPATIGYGAINLTPTRTPTTSVYARDPGTRYKSDSEFFPDVFMSYRFNVRRDIQCRMQVNVRGLFMKEEIIPISTLSSGQVAQYGYRTGQQITFSTTFTF